MSPKPGMVVVYDGECPFCTRYVQMMALKRNTGTVELLDARSGDARVGTLQREGYDLNEGMIALYGGRTYYGSDAMALISSLSKGNAVGRAMGRLLASPTRARLLYPFMKSGRRVVLRILGRSPIPQF